MSSLSHPLAPYGWDEGFADSYAPHAAEGVVPGRIVRVDRGRCDVVVPAPDGSGVRTVQADAALVTTGDPLAVMCTGDWAAVDTTRGYVLALLPRRTAFVRSTSSKRSEGQVLAANVDHAVVVVSLAVELDLGRVERFLALAWESGAAPLVVLTKADLVPDPATLGHLVADTAAAAPGAQVLAVSSETGEGLDVLAASLAGGTTVLLGQSGAGKSTL
ncbi:GTPase RsgA, partial [Streptomyces sp. NRRL B-1677]